MKVVFVNEGWTGIKEYECNFCEKQYGEAYFLDPTTDEEWDVLKKDFDFDGTPLTICEECLRGYCGLVPESPEMNPTNWFKNEYPELVVEKKKRAK